MGLVKLQIHQHLTDVEILVETLKAQGWDDFIIVNIKGDLSTASLAGIEEYQKNHPDKTVILLTEDGKIDFYGIREEVQTERDDTNCTCGCSCCEPVQTASGTEETEEASDS